MDNLSDPMLAALSRRSSALAASQIREVSDEGMAVPGVIPLWFGESAWPSPQKAVEAAVGALRAGDHYYQPNSGRPSLRAAIATYLTGLYGRDFAVDRVTVTASGMQGLALTAQALITSGDRVVTLTPGWPNIAETFRIAGAEMHFEALSPDNGRWSLDIDRLLAALTPQTKAFVVNSPSNPTGWTMQEAEQRAVLDHCRRHGIWIVADDVYARLYFDGGLAPSFLRLADDEDRVISVNSFSKTWSMTGWRLGWIVAPAALEKTLAMLTEFNIAGPAGFIQAAGEKMMREGEPDVADLQARIAEAYSLAADRLRNMKHVDFIDPDGAFYSFFRVEGLTDSLGFAKRLIREAKVGLAPGTAFGSSGQGYLRLCFAQPVDILEDALGRLHDYLARI